MKRPFANTLATLALMTLALALFQRGGMLVPALAGVLLFGVLALLRPELGVLFVPLTAPLYLMPALVAAPLAGRAAPLRLPTYEVALLIVFGATAANWLWRRISTTDDRPPTIEANKAQSTDYGLRTTDYRQNTHHASRITHHLWRYAPQLLFLLTGVLGVVVAAEPSRALREFRWLIVEPLLFYALVNIWFLMPQVSQFSILNSQFSIPIITAFIVGGALVGLIGLLQFAGLDLAGLLGTKQCFAASGAPCDNVVVIGGVRRATSVYGHPNNMGLYLGRVWPLAAALAVAYAKNKQQTMQNKRQVARSLLFVLCCLFCLGGIAVSFSRGAWLGALVALTVLALVLAPRKAKDTKQKVKGSFLPFSFYLLPLLVLVVAGLVFSLRGDVTAGSTPPRLLLWREAIGYIWRYPMGIGLDQFGYYHDPSFERSLIDPALVGTSEQYAAHPHNLLLDIWLRLGPLGLVAFGWLLARFFRRALRAVREADAPLTLGALAAMVAALVHGLVDNFYFVPDLALAFWLLLALIETEIRD